MKKLLITSTCLILMMNSWMVAASNYYQRYPSYNYDVDSDPAYHIMSAVNKIKSFNKNSIDAPSSLLNSFLDKEIVPLFDFQTMARWIVGPYSQYMTAQDHAEFYTNLKDTFLSSLGNHLGSFDPSNTTIRYYPPRYKRNGEASVNIQVLRPKLRPVRLEFRMTRAADLNWKIIDVKANGTSAVLYYRNHFINQLRQYGQ